MKWTEVFVETNDTEAVFGLVYDMGVTGAVITGDAGFSDYAAWGEGFDYIDEGLLDSKKTEPEGLMFYIGDEPESAKKLEDIKEAISLVSAENGFEARISTKTVDDEDWAESWKKYFKPREIGHRLVVKPAWEKYPDSDGKIVVNINPVSLFGTGSHETTGLCMMLEEKYVKPGDKVLDIGCGSGILFLCALLLGASFADGIDIEEDAKSVALSNALENGIPEETFRVFCGDVLKDAAFSEVFKGGEYDVVISNIAADVVIALSGIVPGFIKKGGIYIASGIINERSGEVLAALEKNGFRLKDLARDGEWTAVSAVFKGE